MSESFKKSWRGWISSSEGYEIRLLGRTGIAYRDGHGEIRIDAEAMSSPWNEIVVYSGSVPDTPRGLRPEVLDRLSRAYKFVGWKLTIEDAWPD